MTGIACVSQRAPATLIDLLPTQPGWMASGAHLHYRGNASADKVLPIAGLVVAGLEATSNAVLVGGSPPTTLGSYDWAPRPEEGKQR